MVFMRKLVISVGVALAAMLLVANTPIHFAKAISCNSSASNSFGGASSSVSGSTGSCSTSSSSSSKPGAPLLHLQYSIYLNYSEILFMYASISN